MNASATLPVVAIVDRRFPCDHSFLEGAMEKRLPQLGAEITWLMRSADACLNLRLTWWRSSRVMLLPSVGRLRRGRLLIEHLLFAAFAPALLWRIARIRPRVIFVRNDPLYLLLAVAAAFIARSAVVFQLSHLKEEDLLARARNITGMRALMMRCKGRVAQLLRNYLIARTDQLLVISPSMQDVLALQVRRLPPTAVFPLGVDIGVEADMRDDLPPAVQFTRYAIYVGTLAATRKPRMMVDACRVVRSRFPDFGLVLVGGGGEPAAREQLRSYVRDVGASSFVQFIPDVPRATLPPLIRRAVCGLCVVPAEGVNRTISPTKLMEYLQFECPVVAARGIPEQDEIVEASRGGSLVAFDADAIACAISRFLDEPELRAAMGVAGRRYIEQFRDYSIFARRLFDILAQLRRPSKEATGD